MLRIWANPFTELRIPKIFNLRRDPYERADVTSNTYYDWMLSRAYVLVPAQAYGGKYLATLKEFPPRQKPASFPVGGQTKELEKALSKLQRGIRHAVVALASIDGCLHDFLHHTRLCRPEIEKKSGRAAFVLRRTGFHPRTKSEGMLRLKML